MRGWPTDPHLTPHARHSLRGDRRRDGTAALVRRARALGGGSNRRRYRPNDRPGIALIGCGGMGRGDVKSASRFGDIVALCDVDTATPPPSRNSSRPRRQAPEQFTDFRRVLDRRTSTSSSTRRRTTGTRSINLAAAAAKKDIYAEKPLTLTIDEGKQLVKAVRKENVVLQTGTQQRSHKLFRLACELVRNGRHRQAQEGEGLPSGGTSRGPVHAGARAGRIHWDKWLGQAPQVDYLKERMPPDVPLVVGLLGGPVTDWGAHHNDIARWAIGLDGPVASRRKALTEPIPGGYTTPSEFEATLTWATASRRWSRRPSTTARSAPS